MPGQVRLPDADAVDAARCGLAMFSAIDDELPENLDRTAAVWAIVWRQTKRLSDGWRHSKW